MKPSIWVANQMRQKRLLFCIGVAAIVCSGGFQSMCASEVIVNGQRVSRAAVKQSMNRFITAFPDLQVTITDIVAEGDKVAIWYSVQGTQTGEFEGIRATRKQARWSGADLFRIEKGKIAECRFVDDSLGLLRQLGATLSPPRGQ